MEELNRGRTITRKHMGGISVIQTAHAALSNNQMMTFKAARVANRPLVWRLLFSLLVNFSKKLFNLFFLQIWSMFFYYYLFYLK
jgi:hypothetical protein